MKKSSLQENDYTAHAHSRRRWADEAARLEQQQPDVLTAQLLRLQAAGAVQPFERLNGLSTTRHNYLRSRITTIRDYIHDAVQMAPSPAAGGAAFLLCRRAAGGAGSSASLSERRLGRRRARLAGRLRRICSSSLLSLLLPAACSIHL